ncbi:hypothetical protein [Burkholderia aenigmatica]|uniref:hypothetical protein n=1 Tax=Burkholderia aenigmatica TaxID=2015348 RepID=UPI002652AFC1|nr:hypothetical protein [Burkholderia aenigmatica]MDN7873822.1 hypothetical protein [Burkholderia aenigmatica]
MERCFHYVRHLSRSSALHADTVAPAAIRAPMRAHYRSRAYPESVDDAPKHGHAKFAAVINLIPGFRRRMFH